MKLRERVGLNIQNLRNSRGLSQEQLALAADMDRSYVSEIELAKFSASLDVLERIALALKCQRQSKSEPKGSAKCCHFGVGIISLQMSASIRAAALVI